MFPLVSVIVVGYNRFDLLKRTITSFLNTATYPRKSLELILCDDASPASVQDQMRSLPFDVFLMASENGGMGYNTNKGIQAATGAYILQLQDDWECGGPPDFIEAALALFQERPDVSIISLSEPLAGPHNPHQFDSGKIAQIYVNRPGWRATAGEYVYSDRPHLKRPSFHAALGLYLEGKPMNQIEMDFCRRFEKQSTAKAAFIDGYSCFTHTGAAASFNPLNTRRQPWRSIVLQLPGGPQALACVRGARSALMRRLTV